MDPLEVTAACSFRSPAAEGTGVITRISRTEAEIDEVTAELKNDSPIQLYFRIFETSTDLKFAAKVTKSSRTGFVAEFGGLEPALRNILRMALGKLKLRGKAALSTKALMMDVGSTRNANTP
jgi:hypothetical protein